MKSYSISWTIAGRAGVGLVLALVTIGVPKLAAAPTNAATMDITEGLVNGKRFPGELLWAGGTPPSRAESRELLELLDGDRTLPLTEQADRVQQYINTHRTSAWWPSLAVGLGEYERRNGYFSSALEHWEDVWTNTQALPDPNSRKVADSALGDWLQLLSSLGRTDKMQELFAETKDRKITGKGQGTYIQARLALNHMLNHPEDSYRCGTYALDAVTKALYGTNNYFGIFKQPSPVTGFSLAALKTLADSNHLGLVVVERPSGTDLVVPSVLHWKENHYAAIVGKHGDSYEVVDPTFKLRRLLSADAINHEASGQFLVPAGKVPKNWRVMDDSESEHIFGKGYPAGFWMEEWVPCTCPPCDCPPGASGTWQWVYVDGNNNNPPACIGNCGPPNKGPNPPVVGMPSWIVTEPNLSLWLKDEPMSYQTATEGAFSFDLYSWNCQVLDVSGVNEPGLNDGFGNSLFGTGDFWSCSWISYIDASDYSDGLGKVTLHPPGGGQTDYTNFDGAEPEFFSNNRMLVGTNSSGSATNFTLIHRDGSMDVYGLFYDFNGSDVTNFLWTQQISRFGRTNFFYYDTNLCLLTNVVDADGRTNILTYSVNGGVTNLQQIQDPYGHTVSFAYSPAGYDLNNQLTNITDVEGLSTAFTYSTGTAPPGQSYDVNSTSVASMTTPYGTTSFQLGVYVGGGGREVASFDIITSPNGASEMFQYRDGVAPSGAPMVYTNTLYVPTNRPPEYSGMSNMLDNPDWGNTNADDHMDGANSYYWNREQFAALDATFLDYATTNGGAFNPAILDYSDFNFARLRHWNQVPGGEQSLTLSMEMQPSPDGTTMGAMTWWDYPNKPEFFVQGSSALPDMVMQVLPDGTESYEITQVDQFGNPTNDITTYSSGGTTLTRTNQNFYSTNGVDLLVEIRPDGVTNVAYSYNSTHEVLFTTNAVGYVTTNTYNSLGQATSISQATGLVTTNIYNSSNFLATTYEYTVSGGTTLYFGTNIYTYGEDGLVLTHTDERGMEVTNSWDPLLRLTNVAYPDGTTMSQTYSKLDLVQKVDRLGYTNSYGYDNMRDLLAQTNANGAYTLYSYCVCGALNSMQDALGNSTYYYYDLAGRRTNVLYPDLYTLTSKYDKVNRVTNTVDGVGVSVSTYFDNQGLVYAVSNASGQVKDMVYNINDRITNIVDGNGVVTTNAYDTLNRIILHAVVGGGTNGFSYSSAGLVYLTNELGYVTTNVYDARQRKTAETNADGQTTLYAYSPANDLISLVDGNNHTNQWRYDLYGRVTNKVDATGTNILAYSYDADNRLTNRWSLGRTNTVYSYDGVGNLTNVNYQASHAIKFIYDAINRLSNMNDASGTTSFTYTPAGQLASENGPWGSDRVSYTYSDRQPSALSLQQPDGSATWRTYGYDSANRLQSIASPEGTYDYSYLSGQQTLVGKITLPDGAYITNFYDGLARLTNTTLANSANASLDYAGYTYNNANQRTEEWRGTISTNDASYTYDPIGQLTSDVAQEFAGSTNRLNEQLHYVYDAVGNLNYRTNNTLVENFQVSSVNELTMGTNGGRLTVVGTTTSIATNVAVNGTNALLYGDATFAATNMPLTTSYTAIAKDSYGRKNTNAVSVSLSTNVTFKYDLNGNLTNDGTQNYAYDDENELTQVWVTNQWKSQFTYDGKMRRRVRQEYAWIGSAWTQTNEVLYVYDGNLVVQERDINNNPQVTYTRGKDLSGSLQGAGGIGGLLARTDTSAAADLAYETGASYYHSDGNGNVTMLIDGSQTVVAKYLYDAFGNTLSVSGPTGSLNLYRFSSKEAHPNSGLVYYLYRFYDPNLQRWPNRDPLPDKGFLAMAFPSWNVIAEKTLGSDLYEMSDNNPAGKIDAFGLSGITTGKGNGHGKLCKTDCAWADSVCNAAAIVGCVIIVGGPIGVVCPPCGYWGGGACAAAGVLACGKLEHKCEASNQNNGFGGGD